MYLTGIGHSKNPDDETDDATFMACLSLNFLSMCKAKGQPKGTRQIKRNHEEF